MLWGMMNLWMVAVLLASGLYRVSFRFRPPVPAQRVTLAGTFNNWNPEAQPMQDPDGDGVYETTLLLPAGTYQYKFVVNGSRWYEDPHALSYVPDGFGGRNSVLQVAPGLFPEVRIQQGDGHILRELVRFDPGRAFYLNAFAPGSLRVLVETAAGDVARAVVAVGSGSVPLHREPHPDFRDRFLGTVPEAESLSVILQDGDTALLFRVYRPAAGYPRFRVPRWARGRVVYQIFADRFRNGDLTNDPPNTRPWRYEPLRPPEGWFAFYGGDLKGITDTLAYLRDLGVSVLYLNPIFASTSNHGYDITDYFQINPRLGTLADFDSLLLRAHRLGLRVILDGVFNHCSDQHPFFQDVRRRGPESPYYDWFIIKRWPFPERFDDQHKPMDYYECWWGFGSLPKWNHQNPKVREYLLQAAEFWTRRGIDGWRLDVPNEVPHDFWKAFRRRLRAINPDLYIVGEIWQIGPEWLQGDEFDALMNYPLAGAIQAFARGTVPADRFRQQVAGVYGAYPPEVAPVLFNLLDSHDTPRILTQLQGDTARLRLAVALQMTLPGMPVVYYGDEVGMEGEKDPDCRRVFPWHQPEARKAGVFRLYSRLIGLRNRVPALRLGDLRFVESARSAAYLRTRGGRGVLVAVNPTATPDTLPIPEPWTADTVRFGRADLQGRHLVVPPMGAIIVSVHRP